jgi:hypothetical protein
MGIKTGTHLEKIPASSFIVPPPKNSEFLFGSNYRIVKAPKIEKKERLGQPGVEEDSVTYRGKEYPIMRLHLYHKEIYPKGSWTPIGKISLLNLLKKNSKEWSVDPEAIAADEEIYMYIPDKIFDTEDPKVIAKKWLDEPFELIENDED